MPLLSSTTLASNNDSFLSSVFAIGSKSQTTFAISLLLEFVSIVHSSKKIVTKKIDKYNKMEKSWKELREELLNLLNDMEKVDSNSSFLRNKIQNDIISARNNSFDIEPLYIEVDNDNNNEEEIMRHESDRYILINIIFLIFMS
jgi:hypothetical protein